jgi:hypothetical protein
MAANDGPDSSSKIPQTDDWRQGDVILAPEGLEFVHWADLENPLTSEARDARDASGADAIALDVVALPVRGFVLVSQTCDLVRDAIKRPYVELAPLLEAEIAHYKQIERLAQPRYAVVPGVSEKKLVADLDRIMTAEKSVVARFPRIRGLGSDVEQRLFARALARKRARPALPDKFVECFRPVADHLKKVFKQTSDEAKHLDALVEFRVSPDAAWDSPKVIVTILGFKGAEKTDFEYDWPNIADIWSSKFQPCSQFPEIHFQVLRYDQIDAQAYLSSDELDLDNLSPPIIG